jgi:DNA-binding PadR family transcriptional regulator
MNEVLILASLVVGEATVAETSERLESHDFGRRVDDGSIYVALQRMAQRGYVRMRKKRIVSADGRPRNVGVYRISNAGRDAVQQFTREAGAVRRLRAAEGHA